MTNDWIIVLVGMGTEDRMILPPGTDEYPFLYEQYICDDADSSFEQDDEKSGKMRRYFAEIARNTAATAIFLGACHDHLPRIRFETAHYFLEHVESVKAVFTFSIRRTTATSSEQGIFDLSIFRIDPEGLHLVERRESVASAVVWPALLERIERQISVQVA